MQRNLLVRPSAKRASLTLLLPAAIVLLALMLASFSYAADEAKFTHPDVLVLVMGGMGSNDLVSISYNSVVELPKTQADLDAAAAVGAWQVKDAKGETKSSGGPKPVLTTSISFAARGIIGYGDGSLRIEPFVTALKRFRNIQIIYLVPQTFQFRGLKDFENRYVSVKLIPKTSSYEYRIVVKDAGFEKLSLPLVQPVKPRAEEPKGMPLGTRVAVAVLLALLGAVAVYLLTTYLSRRRAR